MKQLAKSLMVGILAFSLAWEAGAVAPVLNLVCTPEPGDSGECAGSSACNTSCTKYALSGPCANCQPKAQSTCLIKAVWTTITKTPTPGTCQVRGITYNKQCVCVAGGAAGTPVIVVCKC